MDTFVGEFKVEIVFYSVLYWGIILRFLGSLRDENWS